MENRSDDLKHGKKYRIKLSDLVIGLLKQKSSLFVIRSLEN